MGFLKLDGRIKPGKLALSIMVPVVGGSLAGAFANRNTQEQYGELKKPSFFPRLLGSFHWHGLLYTPPWELQNTARLKNPH